MFPHARRCPRPPAPVIALLASCLCAPARAAISLPPAQPNAYGSDGALTITADTTIDLSKAPTGTWDQDNAANVGKGVYDPQKWAVVFKYSSVSIAPGTTVSFKNNSAHAPVVWLVNGNVTINGTVNLSGEDGCSSLQAEPGPGGFHGSTIGGPGFGLGGPNSGFGAGSYATLGSSGSVGNVYGSATLLPLIGGSGGGGYGGAGGGAILVATTGSISLQGLMTTIGGRNCSRDVSNAGSGGGVRLVASTIAGNGNVDCSGGGFGRIRLEAETFQPGLHTTERLSSVNISGTVKLWPDSTDADVRIVSVGGAAVTATPLGSIGPEPADVSVRSAAPLAVVIETNNLPTNATVTLKVTPRYGTAFLVPATLSGGNLADATWTAQSSLPQGTVGLQVRVDAGS